MPIKDPELCRQPIVRVPMMVPAKFSSFHVCCVPRVSAGGLTEAMLLQLGKLPRIKTQEGMASDVDTDKDVGSEATDLGDASDMDVY
jgi:hypothetical protein